MTVKDKVVLITGAARGMGREYVRGFLKQGAKVIATDLSWVPSGLTGDDVDFLAEIKNHPDVMAESMDITIDWHVKRVFKAAIARFGTIDVIINNAGLRARDLYPDRGGQITIMETEVGEWQKMFDTHVFGSLRVIKVFAQPMIEKRSGSIINVGTSRPINPDGNTREGPYPMAKAALYQMSMYLANELRPYNIAVNVLMPSATRSTGSDEQVQIRRAAGGALPRRLRPDSVVPLALYFAEQDAGGVTGQGIQAIEFNQKHELGGFESWAWEEDLKALQAAGQASKG